MLTLILMRHAKSSWDLPARPDHDRPLNVRGRASAQAMGTWLEMQGHVPDEAISSSAERTGQTFANLGINCPVAFTRALYHAGAEDIRKTLSRCMQPKVLLIGHNPGIAECAERLIAEPSQHPDFWRFPTCATMVAQFDVADWAHLTWGSGRLIAFKVPKDIIPKSR